MAEEDPSEDPGAVPQNTEPREKAYCCGNSAQREATLIAKFDLIFSLICGFLIFIFLVIILSKPEYFDEIAKNTPGNATTDLSLFISWPKGAQLSVLIISVVLHLFYIVLSLLLWIGARQRRHKLLLIWFASTIISYTAGFLITILSLIFLQDKVTMSIGLFCLFLYKWYSLWIVKILMREVLSISSYGNGSRDEPNNDNEIDGDGDSQGMQLDKL